MDTARRSDDESTESSTPPLDPSIALAPEGIVANSLAGVIEAAGLARAKDPGSATGLVWCSTQPQDIATYLNDAPNVRWVQLIFAGIEEFVPYMDSERTWTCAKDIYGPAVAEFALGMLITGYRGLHLYARSSLTSPVEAATLLGTQVVILGGGGIGRSLARMLIPLGARITIVSRSGRPIVGLEGLESVEVVGHDRTEAAVRKADAVVLAVPLTKETEGAVDKTFLSWMKHSAWLVNVARGKVVVTNDLVEALLAKSIAGACLDVTDPEPLPADHPLRKMENVLVTPHCANTFELAAPVLMSLVAENCRRHTAGEPLSGIVNQSAGY